MDEYYGAIPTHPIITPHSFSKKAVHAIRKTGYNRHTHYLFAKLKISNI